jgi:K+/H+ antiporter YhaU regulatory subunit KhtT
VLSDLGIVVSEKGSGVTIKSYEYAKKFVKQQNKRQSIDNIKDNIMNSIELQRKEFENLNKYLSELVSTTEHFRSFNPFVPFQILIKSNCLYLNKNINEITFWQNTGATIIAVRRDENIMLSPGPYLQLLENDTIYYITQDAGADTVTKFLYNAK